MSEEKVFTQKAYIIKEYLDDVMKSGVMAYCRTCKTEINDEASLASHYAADCDVQDTWNYSPVYNGKKLAIIIHHLVNSQPFVDMAKGFVEQMTIEHRTLQANTILFFRDVLIRYAKLGDQYVDGRNEYAREIAKKMSEVA